MTKRATLLIMLVFFLQPLALGGWFALIPDVKAALGLSKGELAIALMGVPVALVPALQFAARAIARFGPRRVGMVFFPLQAIAFLLPFAAWNMWSLFAALCAVGVMMAFVEVAMNVYAGRLEKQAGVLIMNRCHGFWAFGVMVGSGAIAVAQAGYAPQFGLAVISGLVGAAASGALPRLEGDEDQTALPRRKFREFPKALPLIALMMFVVTLTEGVMADWAAVFMSERLGESGARAALAVTVFSALMATGRFLGDFVKARVGAVAHARLTIGCAIFGLGVVIAPLPTFVTYVGFALVGLGVSAAYPLGVSAIAALDDRYEAPNIAFAATVAMGGFMIGPPLIGFLSESVSLGFAFGSLIPALVGAVLLSRWLGKPEQG